MRKIFVRKIIYIFRAKVAEKGEEIKKTTPCTHICDNKLLYTDRYSITACYVIYRVLYNRLTIDHLNNFTTVVDIKRRFAANIRIQYLYILRLETATKMRLFNALVFAANNCFYGAYCN